MLHPAQVRRLVLCASFPGDGTTVRPAQSAIAALKSGDPAKVMSDLFPADQTNAQNTYLAALSSWPPTPTVPAHVLSAQSHAVDLWWAGADPAGKKTSRIAAPTLVADGSQDPLDPVANSRALTKLIPPAQLVLYPDAAHAFLFQERRLRGTSRGIPRLRTRTASQGREDLIVRSRRLPNRTPGPNRRRDRDGALTSLLPLIAKAG